MRRGQVFKRCSKCNGRIPDRRCPACGFDRFTWAYVVDAAPPGVQRKQVKRAGFKSKAAALEAMAQLQVEKAAGTYIDPSRMTLGEYLDQWLADADAHGWEGSTKTGYDIVIRNHLKPHLGSTRLQALTSMQIRGHYQWLLKQGKIRRNKRGEIMFQGPLSRKSVQNVHIVLRAALNDAVAADPPLLRKNVALDCFSYSRRKDRPEMLTWAVEEVRAFLTFTAGDVDHALWWLALMTGMRRGELLGLRRRDLMLDRVVHGAPAPALNVRQQYARDGEAGLVFKGLKNDSTAWRTIDLDEDTVAALRAHLDALDFRRRSWGDAYRHDLDLVFCHPAGSPYDPDVITHRFERRAHACHEVLDIRFHDQRHTHATLLLENGETERYVAERLGDTVEMIHQTYGHVTPKMRAGAVQRLAALLSAPAVSAPAPVRAQPGAEESGHGYAL